MPDKQILYYIKNETNADELYFIAIACLERLVKTGKAGTIKAILDSGTTSLYKLIKGQPVPR